jgi:hypothetical protein
MGGDCGRRNALRAWLDMLANFDWCELIVCISD